MKAMTSSSCRRVCVCVCAGTTIPSLLHLKKTLLQEKNFKALQPAVLFEWVNERRSRACHNPNAT